MGGTYRHPLPPLGTGPSPDRPRHRGPRVRCPMETIGQGWHELVVARRRTGHALPLSPAGRASRARSRVALPAAGRARAERGDRPDANSAGATDLDRAALARDRALRTARRRLHAGRHVPGRDRQARPPRGARRQRRRGHAGRRLPGPAQLGLRRRAALCARTASYGRPEDFKAFVEAAHAAASR